MLRQCLHVGEAPPHELLVTRKLAEYKAKHADLIHKGMIEPERVECYWDSIQISPIEGELDCSFCAFFYIC
jgi:hypothetical protein